jgi:hypothetical protein
MNIIAENDISLSNFSEDILKETRGHPIMVKFLLLGDGLHTDVERRYHSYLSGDPHKLQTMLICLLLYM